MTYSRFSALESIANRNRADEKLLDVPSGRISDFFGQNVFNEHTIKKYLTKDLYDEVSKTIHSGDELDGALLKIVANAMKKWAMDKGATHYAHWFQPLTGKTAEKHDSFFTLDGDNNPIEEFSVNALTQQEPDGSSFPGGGLRSTFEARGYTAWDPTSPAFILEVGEGKTLCIPTIFVTYGGEAMDYKLPLLKSASFLENAAKEVCQFFDPLVTSVKTTLGWEQEYFLVDEATFFARPDLILCGRTLVGKYAAKGQQLDDHYFGSIPERVYKYMRDLETECHKLGIPVRTRHNEVGPGQYELAPMYEEVNVAVDHNQLLMDLMDRVARKHKLRVLLHEKPFEGVNGSGKHNNWSMSTNTGKNLLSPGKTPGKNLRFLTFFVSTIRAVWEYADLLRASIASAGNDHRLGANEAPPAIVSVFIGSSLKKVLDNIENDIEADEEGVQTVLNLLRKIPNLDLDNTDRNRTSPFAFTGNKFEIRMVGSSRNCAAPMTVMNTIVGHQLSIFKKSVDDLVNNGMDRDSAILQQIKQYIKESRPILFEGDGYSDDWKKEAAERGLNNHESTPEAIPAYTSAAAVEIFSKNGILTERELHAHQEVMLENYCLSLQIESRTLGEMMYNQVIPAAIKYQNLVADNIHSLRDIGMTDEDLAGQLDILKRLNECIKSITKEVQEMTKYRRASNKIEDSYKRAESYRTYVKPLINSIRICSDRLEYLIDDEYWPIAKYRELMFIK
ncbi:MAG: glutamine synthetase type III [Saprospirales bacterium]|nr:MAG: glutamine synthetase type III [Saprospirales bacterium]